MGILPRRLPPAATPLSWQQWRQGWRRENDEANDFAASLARYLGVPACLLASSGRTALFALLRHLKATRDSEQRNDILLPAYTCPALVKVIQDLSLNPCPIDVLPETLDFAVDQLHAALSERVLAVIYVHPFGIAMPVTQLIAHCRETGTVVIEDAAQALGARYRGRPAGAWGDYGIYSLGPGKGLSTGGGGVVSVNQPEHVDQLRISWEQLSPASRGQSILAQLRLAMFNAAFRPPFWWLATKLGAHSFGDQEESWGYRESRLTAAQASVGRTLLDQLDQFNNLRKNNAIMLLEILSKTPLLQPTTLPLGSDPAYLRLPLLAPDRSRRDSLHAAFWRAGIGAGKMYGRALGEIFPELAHLSTPGATELASRLLTLPTHHFMTGRDFEQIAAVVREHKVT